MSKRVKLNTIRIIAGKWRGRRLPVPEQKGLRPTTDRVRETLFNWLTPDLAGTRCLDLFAGSGALGFESLSRGVALVYFVESSSLAVKNLQKNIALLCGESDSSRACLEQADALNLLSKPPAHPFDIVFLDPPFQSGVLEQTIKLLVKNNWLSPQAIVYIEQSSASEQANVPELWSIHRQGKTGQSAYYLYRTV